MVKPTKAMIKELVSTFEYLISEADYNDMQTFLPYSGFAQSAAALDNKRLGKQRVEARKLHMYNLPRIFESRLFPRRLI
jgi:hypothetical protein